MQTIDGITLADRDGQLVACCRPPADKPPLDVQALRRLLEESDYAGWALAPEALPALAQRWIGATDAFELTLGRREDASFRIEVAADGSFAWVHLKAARGGQPVQAVDLLQALQQAGVVYGIDAPAVQRASASAVDLRVLAASAKAPVKGEDTRFELLVADTRDRTPKVDDQGLIDYHELGDIPTVNPGQPLMRRHPPTPGEAGCDVRGCPLPAAAGLDEPFDKPFIGAVLAADDANLLCAANAGQPVHTRCGVTVEQVLHLKDVNMATGNVHFVGTVEVAGDVHPGMKVEASGDIVVKGLVEGAQLLAGGSVRVDGGVIAHAKVRAGSSAQARFVENSTMHAGTLVVILGMALHSELQALNQVLVGTESGTRGRLVGGTTRATMLVRAPWLGAAAGGLTRIHVGINPAFEARCNELDRTIEHEQVEADKLQQVVKHLKAHGDPRGMLERVQSAWKQALRDWSASLAEKAELDRQLALTREARVEAGVGIGGDVDIAFGKVVRHLRGGRDGGAFCVDELGRVVYITPDGTPCEIL